MLLSVHLGDEHAGEITVVRERVEFRLLETYRARYPRPVLGQVFEDDPERVHRTRVAVPPFFANLLPEGALRELLARQLGIKAEREPYLLAHLGDDLPGNVRVRVVDASNDDEEDDIVSDAAGAEETSEALKFSLAGIQLKFSVLHEVGGKLAIPVHGRGGDWIVKLPDRRYAGVPENEWSMMTLARASGLDVADVELVALSDIDGLPTGVDTGQGTRALAVRRFDRVPNGGRVHIEDFAQILDVRPSHSAKYRSANFETLARLVARIAPSSVVEFVRRLVFHVAIGNGDAHIKNWSLIYPDGIHPVLFPAYDLLSTIQYINDDDLGLNLSRSKRFEEVHIDSFVRLQEKAELPVDVSDVARNMVAKIRQNWTNMRDQLRLSEEEKLAVEGHFKRVPLLSDK